MKKKHPVETDIVFHCIIRFDAHVVAASDSKCVF